MENLQGAVRPYAKVAALSYIPLFWAGMLGIYMKAELANGYSRAVARLLTTAKDTAIDAPLADALPIFSHDILVNLLAVPALIIAVLLVVFRKRAPIAACVVSLLLLTFYFIQLQAERAVGQYQTLRMLYEAAQYAADDSGAGGNYLSMRAISKYLAVVAAMILSTLLVYQANRNRWFGTLSKALVACMSITVLGLTSVALASYSFTNDSGLHQSAVSKAFFTFAASSNVVEAVSRKNLVESFDGFRKLTNTPVWRAADDPLAGRETNANLIFFLMETGPASVLPGNDIVPLLPASIADHSLIAGLHMTTYPYTSDAVFSILTGLYPHGRREVVARGGFRNSKALFQLLSDAGYDTAAFMPSKYNSDDIMLQRLGMQRLFISNRAPASGTGNQAASDADALLADLVASSPHLDALKLPEVRRRLIHDLHALTELKADMRSNLRQNRRFAYLFMPQIAHAPWLQLGPRPDLPSHGHALLQLQARWLAEIVQILEDAGELDNTVVVLTADHGIRTTIEDPAFRRGTIDSYSFHVPFALHAPRTFDSRQFTHAMTSHIDIEPSLSVLMGVHDDAAYTEGVPMWAARDDRRVYFFAEVYGGASGFYDKSYFMNNLVTDQQFRSPTMSFPTESLAPINGSAGDYVKHSLSRFRSLHFDIVSERDLGTDTKLKDTETPPQMAIAIDHSAEHD